MSSSKRMLVIADPSETFGVNSSHLTLLIAAWPSGVCSLLQVGS